MFKYDLFVKTHIGVLMFFCIYFLYDSIDSFHVLVNVHSKRYFVVQLRDNAVAVDVIYLYYCCNESDAFLCRNYECM